MSQVLAAEGGYQLFTLGSSEWFWLYFCVAVAVIAPWSSPTVSPKSSLTL